MFENTASFLPLDAADQVAASKTSKIQLGKDFLLYGVQLLIGDTASATDAAILANILSIRLKHGATVLRECTGAELNAKNGLNGAGWQLVSNGAGAGTRKISLTMYFAEPWRKAFQYHLASLLDTRKLPKKCTIEVDFGAAAGPSLEASFLGDESDYVPGPFIHWDRSDILLGGTAIDYPPINIDGRLLGISIANVAGGVFTRVKAGIEAGKIKHDASDVLNTVFLKQWQMVPQTNRYDIVFDYDDDIMKAPLLSSRNDLKLRFECGAAMAATPAIYEVMRPIV